MWIKFAPWVACIVLGGLWLNARDAIIEEREGCNTSKVEEALEASHVVADAQKAAHEREIQDMLAIVERGRRAEAIALEAAELAESRPEKVRTIIKRVADEDACISAVVHDSVLDCVFDGTGCHSD